MSLGNKHALWFGECFGKGHTFAESESEQRNGQVKFLSPVAKALSSAFVCVKTLVGCLFPIAKLRGNGKCVFNTPSTFESVPDYTRVTSKFTAPATESIGYSVKCNDHVGGDVGLLLLGCGPSAVFFEVPKSSVDSVNGSSGWALTHVFKEIFKRFSPSIAYGNAYSSVLRPLGVRFSKASTEHILVRHVGWALGVLGCVSVPFCHVRFLIGACNEFIVPDKAEEACNKEMELCLQGA